MIEVERSFEVSEEVKQLLKGHVPVSETHQHDAYFDREDFSMFLHQMYLRKRNNTFELKIPIQKKKRLKGSPVFHEVTDLSTIFQHLGIQYTDLDDTMEKLAESGYKLFTEYNVTRKSYKIDGFTVVHDKTSFGMEEIEV